MPNLSQLKHPTFGKRTLSWQDSGPVRTFYVVQAAKYQRGAAYEVREPFAHIRPAYSAGALHDATKGFVVTRNTFDDVVSFDTISEATLYIESLFALES